MELQEKRLRRQINKEDEEIEKRKNMINKWRSPNVLSANKDNNNNYYPWKGSRNKTNKSCDKSPKQMLSGGSHTKVSQVNRIQSSMNNFQGSDRKNNNKSCKSVKFQGTVKGIDPRTKLNNEQSKLLV